MASPAVLSPEFAGHLKEELACERLLTEVTHLLNGMLPDGTIPDDVLQGVHENLVTKVQEDAMPGAVSEVVQPVAEIKEGNGNVRRTFIWKGLGRSALSVAESGYEYHFSEPAFRRVAVEVREAKRSETELDTKHDQVFISPAMSAKDAPRNIAEQEHLANDDSLRVSSAVTDAEGNIVGRKTQSLLVSDVPLSAWVAMLKDPTNVFGKSFQIIDEESALSVMELFDQLDVPAGELPEGPVTLVEAVMKYIEDPLARASVSIQLDKFREDQWRLRAEAKQAAAEWLDFETELARSIKSGVATFEVKRFMVMFQQDWDEVTAALIQKCELPDGGFGMTRDLAARLELAKQKLLARTTKVIIGSPDAVDELGNEKAAAMKRDIEEMRLCRSMGMEAEYRQREAMIQQTIARTRISTGGGCGGINAFEFQSKSGTKPGSEEAGSYSSNNNEEDSTEEVSVSSAGEGVGKVQIARCRIDGCPTSPYKTLVGGCCVCLGECQFWFEMGKDPAEVYASKVRAEATRKIFKINSGIEADDLANAGPVAEAETVTRSAASVATKQQVAMVG